MQRADATAAGEQYAALKPRRGTGITIMLGMEDNRLLGLLSHTVGDMDPTAAHFEDALAFCRKAGFRPELAWTCCDYADALLERNGERV